MTDYNGRGWLGEAEYEYLDQGCSPSMLDSRWNAPEQFVFEGDICSEDIVFKLVQP